jgi:hypothetical protein
MAEESQPAKMHKHTKSSNDTQLEEPEPIGAQVSKQLRAQVSKQLVNSIGDETKIDATLFNEVFLESDVRKKIDDKLIYITQDLPKFRSLHGLTSDVIMKTADKIQGREQAYQHIRKALKEALPLLKASAITLVEEITQTKLAVSTAKAAVDEHNSNARSAAASGVAGDAGADDADLAEGLVPSEAQKDTHDTLDAT